MKRFLCAIAMLVAFIPFVGVKAINETTNYYSYKKGQIVNFYPNATAEAEKDRKALETIIVEDKDTSSRFIKAWSMSGAGIAVGNTSNAAAMNSAISTAKTNAGEALTQGTGAYGGFGKYRPTEGTEAEEQYFINFTDTTKGMNLLTIDDLSTMFSNDFIANPYLGGAGGPTGNNPVSGNAGMYQLTNADIVDRNGKTVKLYDELDLVVSVAKLAFQGSTYGDLKGFVVLGEIQDPTSQTAHGSTIPWLYLADFTFDANGNISDIVLTPAADDANVKGNYMVLPTFYVNKTADCHEEEVPTKCYKCVNENGKYIFKWVKEGTQDARCEEVKDITSKDSCSELVKTGIESHILEFAIVAALCAIALIVVKRKDLFKTI